MKAILVSIQSKHLFNILSGKKTIELRKSFQAIIEVGRMPIAQKQNHISRNNLNHNLPLGNQKILLI